MKGSNRGQSDPQSQLSVIGQNTIQMTSSAIHKIQNEQPSFLALKSSPVRFSGDFWKVGPDLRAAIKDRFRVPLNKSNSNSRRFALCPAAMLANQIYQPVDGLNFGDIEFHSLLANIQIHLSGRAA